MSIDIEPQENPESGNPPPDRLSAVLSVLLAVLLFVAVVAMVLVARQRMQQTALLKPIATVVAKATATGGTAATTQTQATRSPVAQATATLAQRIPATAAPAGTALVAQPTQTRPLAGASAPVEVAKPTTTATLRAAGTVTTSVPAVTTVPSVQTEARTWYFSEGSTVSPFRTSFAIYNPGDIAAKVTVTLYPESGKTVARSVAVAAHTQTTVLANDMLPNAAFSAAVSTDQPVYVERLTVGDRDGTTSSGMVPATTWYFPEGQTGYDFTTWLLVFNPNSAAADVTVTYYPVGGKEVVKKYVALPQARLTIAGQKDVPSGVLGIVVQSSQPVVAEHAIYFDDQKAAYGGPGLTNLSKTWYVGSGNTQVGFTARIAIFNPNKEPAIVKVTLIGSKQAALSDVYSIEPLSKDDIVLNDRADEQFVAAILESDRPVAAQTVTYYMSGDENGPVAAYSAPAISASARQWAIPGVTADGDYDPYVTLFNPGSAGASVTVTYVVQGGEQVSKTYDLAGSGRTTLRVADEVKGKQVAAASVKSTQPIVVERVTMFKKTVGATSSAGMVAP